MAGGGEGLEMLFKENTMYLKCEYAVLTINSLSLKKRYKSYKY